jgi:hypothetical protein
MNVDKDNENEEDEEDKNEEDKDEEDKDNEDNDEVEREDDMYVDGERPPKRKARRMKPSSTGKHNISAWRVIFTCFHKARQGTLTD